VSTSFGSFTFSRLAGALAALWLCGAGSAWAGDGADLASLQALLSDPTTGLCKIFNMSTCPQLPTITQGILEVAALTNSPPEIVAAQNSITPGSNVTAGNPAAVPPDDLLPLNSNSSPALQDLLSTLTPLAFASQKSGTAVATQLYASNADTFLYAVGVSSLGAVEASNLTVPDTVYFFYDDLFRVAQTFTKGQIVAKFSFPLTVLNSNGTENPAVMTTLKITSCANGLASCFTANATGDFLNTGSPQTVDAGQLGIQFALVFSKSPTSTQNHAIFEVAVPLLVTGACVGSDPLCLPGQTPPGPNTDPAYFYFFHNGKPGLVNTATFTAFGAAGDDLGATPTQSPTQSRILPAGASIGLAPTAVPLCTSTTCPPPAGTSPSPGSVPFALCAALPDNSNGPAARLRPAVGAYYAIATDGEMYLSAPVPSVLSACPAL
jgi:hypothetical protein